MVVRLQSEAAAGDGFVHRGGAGGSTVVVGGGVRGGFTARQVEHCISCPGGGGAEAEEELR